jgi:hypothetical protein
MNELAAIILHDGIPSHLFSQVELWNHVAPSQVKIHIAVSENPLKYQHVGIMLEVLLQHVPIMKIINSINTQQRCIESLQGIQRIRTIGE